MFSHQNYSRMNIYDFDVGICAKNYFLAILRIKYICNRSSSMNCINDSVNHLLKI